jgi:hypothetical protein
VFTTNPMEVEPMEQVIGANRVPTKLYKLIDPKGNDIIDEPVSRRDLIDVIIESEIIDDIRGAVGEMTGCGCECCYEAEVRGFAIEMAEDAGYKVLEILV